MIDLILFLIGVVYVVVLVAAIVCVPVALAVGLVALVRIIRDEGTGR